MARTRSIGSSISTGSAANIDDTRLPKRGSPSTRTDVGIDATSGRSGNSERSRRYVRSAPVVTASTTSLTVTSSARLTALTSASGTDENETIRWGVIVRFIDSRGAVSGSVTSSSSARARRAKRTTPGTRLTSARTNLAGCCAIAAAARVSISTSFGTAIGLPVVPARHRFERSRRIEIEQRGDHLDSGDTVDQRMVNLGDERLIPVRSPSTT